MPLNLFEREMERVADPLTEETRKVRRALMVWSLVCFAMTAGGLFPTEVTTFGLKVSAADKVVLLSLFAAILAYKFVAFVAYGAADAARWYFLRRSTEYEEQLAAYDDIKRDLQAKKSLTEDERRTLEQVEQHLGIEWRSGDGLATYLRIVKLAPWLSWTRAGVDFAAPVLCFAVAAVFIGRDLLCSLPK